MDDLIAFLRARLDEERQHLGHMLRLCPDPPSHIPSRRLVAEDNKNRAILRECKAQLARSAWKSNMHDFACTILRALAEPYAEHPDYRPEWRS